MDMDAGTETSRGTKRKAESELPEVTAPGRIKVGLTKSLNTDF